MLHLRALSRRERCAASLLQESCLAVGPILPRPIPLHAQFEGMEPCSVCGHVLNQNEKKKFETVLPTAIIPGFLYLGSYDTASRSEILKAMAITHILNVGPGGGGVKPHGRSQRAAWKHGAVLHVSHPCALLTSVDGAYL